MLWEGGFVQCLVVEGCPFGLRMLSSIYYLNFTVLSLAGCHGSVFPRALTLMSDVCAVLWLLQLGLCYYLHVHMLWDGFSFEDFLSGLLQSLISKKVSILAI